MSTKQITVHLIDNTVIHFSINAKLTVENILRMVVSQVGVKEIQYFGLCFYRDTPQKKGLFKEWLVPHKRLADYLHYINNHYELHLQIKFFTPIENLTANLVHQFYLQALQEVTKGSLKFDSEETFKMCALALQENAGDYQCAEDAIQRMVLPTHVFKSHPLQYCEDSVLQEYKKLEEMGKKEARLKYLTEVQKHPSYGQHFYLVHDKGGTPWLLSIGFKGIGMYDNNDNMVIRQLFCWENIKDVNYKDKKFMFNVKSNKPRDCILNDDKVKHASLLLTHNHVSMQKSKKPSKNNALSDYKDDIKFNVNSLKNGNHSPADLKIEDGKNDVENENMKSRILKRRNRSVSRSRFSNINIINFNKRHSSVERKNIQTQEQQIFSINYSWCCESAQQAKSICFLALSQQKFRDKYQNDQLNDRDQLKPSESKKQLKSHVSLRQQKENFPLKPKNLMQQKLSPKIEKFIKSKQPTPDKSENLLIKSNEQEIKKQEIKNNFTKLIELKEKKKQMELLMQEKIDAYKSLCLKESMVTGRVNTDEKDAFLMSLSFDLSDRKDNESGNVSKKRKKVARRRFGTSFILPPMLKNLTKGSSNCLPTTVNGLSNGSKNEPLNKLKEAHLMLMNLKNQKFSKRNVDDKIAETTVISKSEESHMIPSSNHRHSQPVPLCSTSYASQLNHSNQTSQVNLPSTLQQPQETLETSCQRLRKHHQQTSSLTALTHLKNPASLNLLPLINQSDPLNINNISSSSNCSVPSTSVAYFSVSDTLSDQHHNANVNTKDKISHSNNNFHDKAVFSLSFQGYTPSSIYKTKSQYRSLTYPTLVTCATNNNNNDINKINDENYIKNNNIIKNINNNDGKIADVYNTNNYNNNNNNSENEHNINSQSVQHHNYANNIMSKNANIPKNTKDINKTTTASRDCIEYLITKVNSNHSSLNNENKKVLEGNNDASISTYNSINNVVKSKNSSNDGVSIYSTHYQCHSYNNPEARLHNDAKLSSKRNDINVLSDRFLRKNEFLNTNSNKINNQNISSDEYMLLSGCNTQNEAFCNAILTDNAPTNDTPTCTSCSTSDTVCCNNVTHHSIKSNDSLQLKPHLIENLSVYLYPNYNQCNSNQTNKDYVSRNSKNLFSDSIPKIKAPEWSLMSRRNADPKTAAVNNKDTINNSADNKNNARDIKSHTRSRSKLKINKQSQSQMNNSKEGHEAQKESVQHSRQPSDQACTETVASKHATILPTPQHSPFLSTAGKSFHQFSPDVFIYRNIFPTLSFASSTTPFDNIVPSSPQKFSYAEKVAKLRAGGV